MLPDTDLEKLMAEQCIDEAGRKLIRKIRKSEPVREPNSRLGTSIVWAFSKKMGGVHIKLESRTGEAPMATIFEHDNDVLEYWAQPHTLGLTLRDAQGTAYSKTTHVPDFLVIRKHEIGFEEYREEGRLLTATEKNSQFYKDKLGCWHYRAAEDYANSIGLYYKITSSISLPRVLIDNIRFLKSYFDPQSPALTIQSKDQINEALKGRGYASVQELIHTHGIKSDDLFLAVANCDVFVDLRRDLLHAASEAFVYKNSVVAAAHSALIRHEVPALPIPGMGKIKAGTHISYDGKQFTVLLVGGGEVLLRDNGGAKIKMPVKDLERIFDDITVEGGVVAPDDIELSEIPSKDLEISLKRLDALSTKNSNDRTIRRWQNKVRGKTSVLGKLASLLPEDHKKGNRNNRILPEIEAIAEKVIKSFYNTPTCPTALAAYRIFSNECSAALFEPTSYATFCKRVKEISSIRDRKGKRKAYQTSHIPLHLDYLHPVHGVRPHEVCYIDHTIVPIATCGLQNEDLGKPTFTLATDGNTTQCRAMYLCYEAPSSKIALMILRDYVRRNHRLPAVLVVDGGREFRSAELLFFCEIYGIDIRFRRNAKPRDGSPVERAFGFTESELISQLEGNTRRLTDARMVSKNMDPFEFRKWTLTALHGAIEEYLFKVRDTREHPTLGVSPETFEKIRLAETGIRDHTLVKFDQNLMLMTCPHSRRPMHKIDRQRGVWVDNQYYWHDSFRTLPKNDKFELRVEPWNSNVVYVNLNNKWVTAICRDLRSTGGRTRYENEIAVRESRRRAKVVANSSKLTKQQSEKMAQLWQPENFDQRISLQQRETRSLYERLGMTTVVKTADLPDVMPSISEPTPASLIESDAVQHISNKLNQTALQTSAEEQEEVNKIWSAVNGYV